MIGFFVGLLTAVALLAVAAGVRRYRWRSGARRRPFFLRRVFRRLDTRPEQEAVIEQAVHGFLAEMRGQWAEVHGARNDVARLLRDETLEEEALDVVFERYQSALDRARTLADETLRKVHLTLEPGQREQLATMLEAGWRHRRHARG